MLFVPYALSNHDEYLKKVSKPFQQLGYEVEGIHQHENPIEAVKKAQAIFVGGGNTFRLLKKLYDLNLVETIRKRVLNDGIPYIGSSAGTNVATRSINTTNDMPIVYPPSFEALKLVPFNINPHFLDVDPKSTHHGETREERIVQYLEEIDAATVLALREGSTLEVNDMQAKLIGIHNARLFVKNKDPVEVEVGTDLSFLLKEQ